MKRGFLIDMDGVIYKNDQMIDGADAFIDRLLSLNMPFRFLTNNSQHARRDIATKLKCTGIEVDESHIFTCAMATARFLARQKANGTAYVIGEGGLLRAMDHNGYSIVDCKPDYVVVGEGHSLTLEVIEKATNLIDGGAKLIATNLYANCPTADGIRPGCHHDCGCILLTAGWTLGAGVDGVYSRSGDLVSDECLCDRGCDLGRVHDRLAAK